MPQDSLRADGSTKGNGFLGPLTRPDGAVSSEISIGVNIDGKEVEIPTLVPTLTPQERQFLLSHDGDASTIPDAIVDKAVAFAKTRQQAGRPYFAEASESPSAAPQNTDVPLASSRKSVDPNVLEQALLRKLRGTQQAPTPTAQDQETSPAFTKILLDLIKSRN